MRIRRLTDQACGWAFEMRGRFRFDGQWFPRGTWVVEVDGARYTVSPDELPRLFWFVVDEKVSAA